MGNGFGPLVPRLEPIEYHNPLDKQIDDNSPRTQWTVGEVYTSLETWVEIVENGLGVTVATHVDDDLVTGKQVRTLIPAQVATKIAAAILLSDESDGCDIHGTLTFPNESNPYVIKLKSILARELDDDVWGRDDILDLDPFNNNEGEMK